MAITINPISPVAFSVFGLDIRWYALAYVTAFVLGFWILRRLMSDKKNTTNLSEKQFDDLFTALVLGVIIGGRLGYVFFYNLPFFLNHPLEVFSVWKGGMSFHGGLIGVIVSVILFARKIEKNNKNFDFWVWFKTSFGIMDFLSIVGPIGLFFGRIANFINMEVMGRVTDKPWGIVFSGADQTPRHASPLYEASLEGIALFIIMFCLYKFTKLREKVGALSGIFAMLYAIFRILAEQFRAPDPQIGFLTSWGLTMGQLLSGIMFFAGAIVFTVAFKKK